MKPRFESILELCIEDGVQMGLRRAFKHNEAPTEEIIAATVQRAIWEQIEVWFERDNVSE